MVLLHFIDGADKHGRPPPLRRRPRRRDGSPGLRLPGSSLCLAAALSPLWRHPPLAAAAGHRHRRGEQYLLRRRRGADAEQLQHPATEETNDDDRTVVPLLPFEIRLSNVPPTSSLAIVNANGLLGAPGVDSLLEGVNGLGAEAFESSHLYGERFLSWDAGEAWASEYAWPPAAGGGGSPSMPAAADSRGSDAAAVAKGDGSGQGGASGGDGAGGLGVGTGEGTTLLTIGKNGTVTFDGAYWEDDPSPENLTDFLVSRLNSGKGRAGLLNLVRPLACDPEEILGMDCDVWAVAIMAVADDANASGVGAKGEVEADEATAESTATEGSATLGGIQAETPGEVKDGSSGNIATDTATDPGPSGADGAAADQTAADGTGSGGESSGRGGVTEADEVAPDRDAVDGIGAAVPGDGGAMVNKAGEAAPPQATRDSDGGDSGSSALKWIIPVSSGAALLAFLIAGLLYRRRRNERRKRGLADKDGLLEEPAAEDQADPDAAAAVYDAITGGETATASPTPKDTKANIDNILEDFSSDCDSSYVSGDTSENNLSMTSGLTGILSDGLSATTPLDDEAREDSRLSSYSAGSAGRDGPQRGGSAANGAAAAPVGVRRQESFVGKYRTRSAMAKLNLKKDILHVQDEAGDVSGGGGERSGESSHARDHAARGVARTVSPKKMMEGQRLSEKLHLRPTGVGRGDWGSVRSRASRGRMPRTTRGPRRGSPSPPRAGFDREKMKEEELREERESSKDLILPADFRRSDSAGLDPRSGGSESDDSSNLV